MAGRQSAFRGRVFSAIHAEGLKAGFNHDALRDMARSQFSVKSMSQLSDAQLSSMYRQLSGGKMLKRRGALPTRGEIARGAGLELASSEDLAMVDQQFASMGFTDFGKSSFLRRQLEGSEVIRTRGDVTAVMGGLRAFSKRGQKGA